MSVWMRNASRPLFALQRPGELDGPEAFHLVLLDNGRSRILSRELAGVHPRKGVPFRG